MVEYFFVIDATLNGETISYISDSDTDPAVCSSDMYDALAKMKESENVEVLPNTTINNIHILVNGVYGNIYMVETPDFD